MFADLVCLYGQHDQHVERLREPSYCVSPAVPTKAPLVRLRNASATFLLVNRTTFAITGNTFTGAGRLSGFGNLTLASTSMDISNNAGEASG